MPHGAFGVQCFGAQQSLFMDFVTDEGETKRPEQYLYRSYSSLTCNIFR